MSPQLPEVLDFRHAAIRHLMILLVPINQLSEKSFRLARSYWDCAIQLCMELEDGLELEQGLRKLLESRDCIFRQSALDSWAKPGPGHPSGPQVSVPARRRADL